MGAKVIVLGCGDVGSATARALKAKGYQVAGVRRSAKALPDGIETLTGDMTDPAAMADILGRGWDYLLISPSADSFTESDYRQAYVVTINTILSALPAAPVAPRRLIFTSSTSVYGQSQHQQVDENSDTEPAGFAGRCMLEAEAALGASAYPTTVVRLAGIYGPGRRRLIEQVRDGVGCAEQPVQYTNRIHRDDCAGVLAHLIERCEQGLGVEACYLGVDDRPAPMWEVKQWLAEQLGVAPNRLKVPAQPRRRVGSKRCSNQRLRDSGYRFIYPDYRAGYSALLKSP